MRGSKKRYPTRWILMCLCLTVVLAMLSAPLGRSLAQGGSGNDRQRTKETGMDQNAVVNNDVETIPSLISRETLDKVSQRSNTLDTGRPTYVSEKEPNNSAATAQALLGSSIKVKGTIQPGTDQDWFSFTATAGDRVYAASQTNLSAGGSGLTGDGTLEIFAADGTTILEADNDDGSFSATAPSIAGLVLTTTGLHYIKMRHSSASPAAEIDPYDLYVRILSGSPTAEMEPNGVTPNPLPANGWVSGTIDPAGPPIDTDTFSLNLNAGDTVFISLDADPERNGTTFNPRLGIGVFDGFILLVNDGATVSPNSEAFFMSIKTAGSYFVYVDTAVAGAGPNATYHLAVSVYPGADRVCTDYTSTNVPVVIPVAAGIATSTLDVPNSQMIANLKVNLNITHSALGELDVSLVGPDGNEVVLFDDPPAASAGTTAPQIDVTLDDEAGMPMNIFGINKPLYLQPEPLGRLDWFKNQDAQGTWTLNVRDDAGTGSGTLNSWGITVCEEPRLSCPITEGDIFSEDFNSSDGGFTHSGTADEWERGLPSFAPITTCNGGSAGCWKTDLDNTYNNAPTGQRVDQELVSPNIVLNPYAGRLLTLEWAMKYQVEGSHWDNAYVEVREVGNPSNALRVFEWAGPTMTRTVGSPAVSANTAAGWGTWQADISRFGGKTVQVFFHLDQDDSVALTGLAIDDVSVSLCGIQTSGDFDSDGTTDLSVFRPSTGDWWILNGGANTVTQQRFGDSTDIPVPGDYDADGDTGIAVYRNAAQSVWYESLGSAQNFNATLFGLSGDEPVPGDYDGDGETDIAVWRDTDGVWYILQSGGGGLRSVAFGITGDRPVQADYDGDGKTDIAVYRDGTWYILQSFTGTTRTVSWGNSTDTPVTGDYDGDRQADISVFRGSDGTWHQILSSTLSPRSVAWGATGDIPVPGDYDGDRKTDIAVFRPLEGNWYRINSSDGSFRADHWGQNGDVPTPGSGQIPE